MDFTYNTYEQYLEAYTYLIRVLENFTYIRSEFTINVINPDEELIATMESFK